MRWTDRRAPPVWLGSGVPCLRRSSGSGNRLMARACAPRGQGLRYEGAITADLAQLPDDPPSRPCPRRWPMLYTNPCEESSREICNKGPDAVVRNHLFPSSNMAIRFWYRREFDMEHEVGEHGRKLRALLVGSNEHVPADKSLGSD
ncbi:hypothetical protein SBBP2_2480002 [Burkholderiales bacterium]|nr:hypothetical protein SBBP2_2480002 [Burkholderiales bacterium]